MNRGDTISCKTKSKARLSGEEYRDRNNVITSCQSQCTKRFTRHVTRGVQSENWRLRAMIRMRSLVLTLLIISGLSAFGGEDVGVVSFVKVLSDKVEDVSSLEAWKKSFIKDGMSDKEKALKC